MEVKCGFENTPSGTESLVTYGPTLLVDIGFDPAYVPGNNIVPALAATEIPALIDTGASECCIDGLLATQLKLPIVDRYDVSGVHGVHPVNVHMAQMHVKSLGLTMYGRFAAVDLASGGKRIRP